jgi:hypothetical protein
VENYCGPKKAFEAPRLRHLPWLTLIRFGKWDEVLALPKPANTNDFLVDRAVWHFARGLAFASRKDAQLASQEHAALAEIAAGEDIKKLSSPVFPVADTLKVAELWLAAKVAGASGDKAAMAEGFAKALAAEDAIPYMEPAFWPLPVRPALGAALLDEGKAADAEKTFREDLKRFPRNGWALLGLEHSLSAQGKKDSAALVRTEFENAWRQADTPLRLEWF